MASFPFTVDVEEIRKNINSLGSKEEKIEYLLLLRDDYYVYCYNTIDDAIEIFIYTKGIQDKFERIPYSEKSDTEQTHISHSEFMLLLRHIDSISLPFVKEDLLKLDKDIKEETDILINDYELFGFDIIKVLNHSNTFKENRILYLQAVKTDYEEYFKMRYRNDLSVDVYYEIRESVFLKEIDERIIAIKRYPGREFPNLTEVPVKNESSVMTEKQESTNKEIIKLHWQKDNVLLPYLFDVLFKEGFISETDFAQRNKFIEQSFLKKSGKGFPAKEVVQARNNYLTNEKTEKKPRNAFMVDKIAKKLIDKKIKAKNK